MKLRILISALSLFLNATTSVYSQEKQEIPVEQKVEGPENSLGASNSLTGADNKELQEGLSSANSLQVGEGLSNIVDTLMGITMLGSEWVLWLLLLLSVVSLAIMFDRMYYFYQIKINFDKFLDEITSLLKAGKDDEVEKICKVSRSVEANVAIEALASKSEGPSAIEKGTTSYMVRCRTKMEKGLTFLGTMGNNAPFIGLFGTVLGIIKAFQDLSSNPAGGPSVVMAGISEALIATAVGLFVAIPAVIAFNWFQRIVNQKMSNAEAVQNILMKHFAGK